MAEENRELTITRVYDAPRDLVWKAWTDPKMVQEWWGPKGVTNTVNKWESQKDGKIDLVMHAGKELGPMAGQEWPMTGEFKEIEEPNKLVFTGNAIVDGKEVLQHLATVTLDEKEGKTKMIVHIVVTKATPEAAGPLSGMEMGWNMQLDKLAEFLSK